MTIIELKLSEGFYISSAWFDLWFSYRFVGLTALVIGGTLAVRRVRSIRKTK